MTMALEGGEGSASHPGRSLPPGRTQYPLYRRLGGPQGRSGQVRKISLPPGFDPWTAQPVASRYTDCTTRPTCSARRQHKIQYTELMSEYTQNYMHISTYLNACKTYTLKIYYKKRTV